MNPSTTLDDAQILLLAVQLTAEAQLRDLHGLLCQRDHLLQPEIIYRILLTYCPQDVPAKDLLRILQQLEGVSVEPDVANDPIDTLPVRELSPQDARSRVQKLHLLALPESLYAPASDLLSRYLLARAYQSDSSGDDLLSLVQVLVPFFEHSPPLRNWFVSKLLPLLRVRYEYFSSQDHVLLLQELDTLHGRSGVARLLNTPAKQPTHAQIGRDLRGVVGPWIYGHELTRKRKVDQNEIQQGDFQVPSWQDVNEWLLSMSLENFALVEQAVLDWQGPQDIDLGGFDDGQTHAADAGNQSRYYQAALASIYSSVDCSTSAIARFQNIIRRISDLAGVGIARDCPGNIPAFSKLFLQTSRAALLYNALLGLDNQLTRPSQEAIFFLQALVESISLLQQLKTGMTINEAASICLFAPQEQQLQELKRILHRIVEASEGDADWTQIRRNLIWLRSWTNEQNMQASVMDQGERRALLWRLSLQEVESAVFSTMLSSKAFAPALEIFTSGNTSLSSEDLEGIVVDSIFQAYDNASNGNRTRGGMLRAYQTLKAFQGRFPTSQALRRIEKLISATHSLSFYHLTMQPGVPFQPVGIRLQKDPLLLLEKVLEQNDNAYTKLDDLVGIGREMVEAGLPMPRLQSDGSDALEIKLLEVQHRVTYMAISAALSSNDFDTAYSYITTRFSADQSNLPDGFLDDISWRAAYEAGIYDMPTTKSRSLVSRIQILSHRMELLSEALMLAPKPDSLSEILGVWQRCEEELNALKADETAQARQFDNRASSRDGWGGSTVVPGGFGTELEDREQDLAEMARIADNRRAAARGSGSSSYLGYKADGEEGPIGLFDIAKGAATALQRSVVGSSGNPARSSTRDSWQSRGSNEDEGRGSSEATSAGSTGRRIRKRDQISNLVTGGLVSGMSWVLGAQPVSHDHAGNRGYDERTALDGEEE